MAHSGSPLKCIGLVNDFIYFEEQTDLDSDCYRFTCSKEKTCHLCYRSENQYLILTSEGQLEIKNLTTTELLQPESKFNIKIYKEQSYETRLGRLVMLYVNHNQKKMVVCCSNNEIQVEEMDPPQNIDEDEHKALFYLVHQSTSQTYMFESTVQRNRFLAFKRENDLLKLVLKEKVDEVDKHCQITLYM